MCTCISTKRFFGRTLDVEASYGEKVVVTPRNFPLPFRQKEVLSVHYAVMGMAHVENGYPLYYDAMNEHGLCIAGLHFPESCRYFPETPQKDNIAPFELPLWLLSQCKTTDEAMPFLQNLNLWREDFSPAFPSTPLHWMLADSTHSIVIESCIDGVQLHENPTGVLTNEPPFLQQTATLQTYSPHDRAAGLPGAFTSPARFQRAAYVRQTAVFRTPEDFFHAMQTVSIPKGCVKLSGRDHYTFYTSCCDRQEKVYSCTRHHKISEHRFSSYDADGKELIF